MTEPDTVPQTEETRTFQTVFECTARSAGKMRCDMTVRKVREDLTWELASDEYDLHGGDGTAPLPIAYFVAGLTACLMTQIRAFSKRLRIPVEDVRIFCRCEWEGSQVGRAPYETKPVGFSMDIEIDGPASQDDRAKLIRAAQKGCFIEQTIVNTAPIHHRLKTESGWVDV